MSDSEGGLEQSPVDGDDFGVACQAIGDLNGDGVTELAVGAHQEGNAGAGAVWVLFMNANGTVANDAVLSGLSGLESGDRFGSAIAAMGDLDGDGVPDLAVGAILDEGPSEADTGSVWILYMNSDGTLKSSQRITEGTLGFDGDLDFEDRFGVSVASIGDLDADGFPDLAVGAMTDDEGVSGSGTVWILFLEPHPSGVQVRSTARINALNGIPVLALSDQFGSSIACLGDLDGAGPSVRTLAIGARLDDQVGGNAGAVYIVSLDAQASVLGFSKIPNVSGGVAAGDLFGASVANIGDIDRDGVTDLFVGASFADPSSGTVTGNAYVLRLNSAGAVVGLRGIGPTSGDVSGIQQGDLFGQSVASLGDLDRDGRPDVAVGAMWDDGGGTDRGAVHVLFLNDGTIDLSSVTVWQGGSGGGPSDWDRNGNWSNSPPTSNRTAIIPDVALQPVIRSGRAEACGHLLVREGASVTLESGGSLEIFDGATLHGPLSGSGAVTLLGGPLSGASSVAAGAGLTFDADVEVRGGPLTVTSGTTLTVEQDLTIAAGAELHCQGPVMVQGGGATVLSGPGTLDCDGDLVLDAFSTAPPRIEVGGDLSIDSAAGRFQPASGSMTFDGVGPQSVTETGGAIQIQLHDLELASGADVVFGADVQVLGDTRWEGAGASTGSITFSGDVRTAPDSASRGSGQSRSTLPTIQAGDIYAGGDVFLVDGILDPSGRLVVDTTGGIVVSVPNGVSGDVEVVGTGTAVFQSGAFSATGDFIVTGGTVVTDGELDLTVQSLFIAPLGAVDVQSNLIRVFGDPDIDVLGELRVGAGGELGLTASAVTVGDGVTSDGLLRLDGVSGNRARLVAADGLGGYSVHVRDHAQLEAGEFLVQRPGPAGLRLDPAAQLGAVPLDLRNGTFDTIDSANGSMFLSIERSPGNPVELVGLRFENGIPATTFNVVVPPTSERVLLTSWSGDFGGPDYEDPGMNNAADWGTRLLSFLAQEKPSGNRLRWKISGRGETDAYVLYRAPVPGAFTQIATVLPTGPFVGVQWYEHFDPAPGTVWRYRLEEHFPNGSQRVLGLLTVDGIPNPTATQATSPPAPLPFLGNDEPNPPRGAVGTCEVPVITAAVVELGRGPYSSFELRGRGAAVTASSEGEAVIDVSEDPVRIVDVPAGDVVELTGLHFLGAAPGQPDVVVSGCAGLVWLADVQAAEILVESCRAVVLSASRIERLQLTAGARVFAVGGSFAALALERGTRLESFGLADARTATGAGEWSAHPPTEAELVVTKDGVVELRAPARSRAWILASPSTCTTLLDAGHGFPMLLDRRRVARIPLGTVPGSGTLSLEGLLPGTGEPLHLQAVVLNPETEAIVRTNLVLRWR